MIRALIIWLLLMSQFSIGLLGAHAAELSVNIAMQQLLISPASLEFDDGHATIGSDYECDDAETVRPRKSSSVLNNMPVGHQIAWHQSSDAAASQKVMIKAKVVLKKSKKKLSTLFT